VRWYGLGSVTAVRLLTAAAAALLVSACADVPGRGDVRWGEHIAQANCARCHAIGLEGNSPNGFAPPFRELRGRYPVEVLNATFTPYTLTGHAPMPSLAFRADDLGDLLAYVRSVQAPGSGAWPKPPFAQCGVGAVC
jgi:mono/diheme cytochrome c family protein